MADNSTGADALGGALDGLNATLKTTGDPLTLMGYFQDMGFLLLEAKLLAGAMGIIYLGAHAALRRPPSAAPARDPKKPGQKGRRDDDEQRFSQGLEPSDAIVFPLMAGALLIGLYYLIQWLKDPALLNKILQWYMSTMSIASVLSLYAHGIQLATSLVFPRYWRAWDGSLRRVNQKDRTVVICDDAGNPIASPDAASSPFPGPLAVLGRSQTVQKAAWAARRLLTQRWVLRFFLRGTGEEKVPIKFAHALALVMSLATAVVYFSTTSTFLSNMLGYGMCYGSFLVLSPTDFLTGLLVLCGLFVYDIVMVFYTPYMITVATTLDVPIKLTFQTAGRRSILGLGDIVLPGILIGWALRFDLWLYYLRKVKYESTDLKIVEKDSAGAVATRSETKHMEVKAPYVNVQGTWGDVLWASGPLSILRRRRLPPELAAARFPKTYFNAAMAGYGLGMGVTLVMLVVFGRGQPALLYLVPGVLGGLLLMALVRGELKELWMYTEDGSLDTEDVVVDLDASGKAVKTLGKLEGGVLDMTKSKDSNEKEEPNKSTKTPKDEEASGERSANGKASKEAVKAADAAAKDRGHQVFLLSLEAPAEDED